ncbi:MAG: phosphotransferase [Actinomycetia bacterium]|nr:phosphotransferase [Actinomycetes bacterium]
MSEFPILVEDLTAEWLSGVLGGEVTSFETSPVGTGQMALCYRLELTGDGVPSRLVAKLPNRDPGYRSMVIGVYRAETTFYRDVAPTVDVRVPRCHHVSFADDGEFVLLLEDLHPFEQGDQIDGCTVEQARDALANLAGLHGPRWCDPTLVELDGLALPDQDSSTFLAEVYGQAVETFLDDLGGHLEPGDHEVLRGVTGVLGTWGHARQERFGLVHGDYRLDNLLFAPDGGATTVAVDWQTLSLGLPARDLAYFLATCLEPDARREHESDLVSTYHEALPAEVRAGYPLETCLDDYSFAVVQAPITIVLGQVYGTTTDRGDRMFATMARRAAQAMRDLDTLALAAG